MDLLCFCEGLVVGQLNGAAVRCPLKEVLVD
jgi:hypothetical protein